MNKIYFRYSEIYEYMLSSLDGQKLSTGQIKSGYEFVNKYIDYWEKYNSPFFEYYKSLDFIMPDFWIAYFIYPRKGITPFSDPLTVFIKDSLDEVTATLMHELTHVTLSYGPNSDLEQDLWKHIEKTYPKNNFETNIELMTLIITRGLLIKIFGNEKANELLSIEKNYSSLKKAWQIIDSQPKVLEEQNPIDAIYKLR